MKNVAKSAGYLVFYFLFQVLVMFLCSAFFAMSGAMQTETEVMNAILDNMLLITIVSNGLSVLVLALFFGVRKKNFAREINLKKVRVRRCALPCFMAFAYSMVFALVTYNTAFVNAEQIARGVAYYSGQIPGLGGVMHMLALLVFAPLAEEVIFRGLILTRLQRSFSDTAAVIVSGILFGLIHAMAGGGTLVAGAVIMGIIFGIVCVKTDSLLPAIAAHMAANLPDFLLAALPHLSNVVRYGMIVFWGAAFAVGMAAFFKRGDK